MTNLFALCLVLTTLFTAEVWSPSPATTTQQKVVASEEDVIVKDGHRVVVVEYDRDGKTNTRVSISPPSADQEEQKQEDKESTIFRNAKEKAKETASYFPNVGQGVSQPVTTEEARGRDHHATAGEVICDAFGKCRQKIASVVGRAKDKASDTVDDVGDAMEGKAYDVKETVARGARDVEDTVADKAGYAKEKVAETAYDAKESMAHKAHNVKENMAHKAHESKERVKDEVRGKAADKSHNAWERVKTAARELASATAKALSPTKVASVVGLTAIAAAFGTSVWVTFVSSYVLASVLGKQQFGVVQSKLYPVYFKATSIGILVGLLGHVLSRRRKLLTDATEMWQGVNLLFAFFMIEANKSFVEPRATKAMFERMKAEKEEGRGGGERTREQEARMKLEKLSERLSKLNTYSSWLNIMMLMSLTWHFVYLGQRLGAAC